VSGGVYDLAFQRVPLVVCRAIEKAFGIRQVYSAGLVCGGQLFGMVVMILTGDQADLVRPNFVQTFISQAAIVLQRRRAEEALQESEARYRLLLEEASELILVTDAAGIIIDANRQTCLALGRPLSELIGHAQSELIWPEDRDDAAQQWARLVRGEPLVDVRRLCGTAGRPLLLERHAKQLPDGRVLMIAHDIGDRHRLEQAIIATGNRERRALGETLHDSLGQHLTGITLLHKVLEQRLRERQLPEADEAARIGGLIREAVQETRRIARGLCGLDITADGLPDALRRLAEDARSTFGVVCQFSAFAARPVPDAMTAVHLYRIAQESITNAARHGKAKTIGVQLAFTPDRGRLTVQDDGCGIPEHLGAQDGMGLNIMRYRARMIHGMFQIGRRAAGGTLVVVAFPCPGGTGGSAAG
jgi:PAS domain S-box-containing protein